MSFDKRNSTNYVVPQNRKKNQNPNKCYTCKPHGTLKEHIISQSENFVFNHDLFRRPLIIITSKEHYHTIYDVPDAVKLQLFEDIRVFVDFWNLNQNYQLMINNGDSQTHHHFHVKMKIDDAIANRMRRDHFTRINLEKSYTPFNQIKNESNIRNDDLNEY
jgi:diadenosine tetraphosphate (Ap4A) HIT family hydrolase